ncbi:hypothetical protein TWF102_005901 [Orbilia oligospora]|uniref:F-box domain-containing protein n=1 Tax=Orbilia oligospora TaxID=2813651 RepID=A0A7C8JLI9_ORBOL|nr:hypothetical protein TWF706_011102 [Orbilia oligospora]KAF3098850.1 hypothetical protein TWF102_005901 [Orbilia oligospora]KAF3108115.1 hypothetical protein TWF103_005673 [Orbilia oligospora]KAF3130282.1 hypothetical protein TWF703_008271 [Orbilia oligospora]
MHIHDLPTELHIEILKHLRSSISDQISISLTCQRWSKILDARDFKLSRYNYLPQYYNIGIHKLFDIDENTFIPSTRMGYDCKRSELYYKRDLGILKLGCEYDCSTAKVTSFYYLFGHRARDNEVQKEEFSNITHLTKVVISTCPFLDEPLVIHKPGLKIMNTQLSDCIAVSPMEQRTISKYRKILSQDPGIHPIRPMSVGKHAQGHILTRVLRIAKCECDLNVRYICSTQYEDELGPYPKYRCPTGVSRCRYDLGVFWPAGVVRTPSRNVTVRQTVQAVVNGVLNCHLNEDVMEPSYSYVRSFGFASAITAPWKNWGRDNDDGCRWWHLEGVHYGPWKKVCRIKSADEYDNAREPQGHEGDIVDRVGAHSIS